MVGVRQTVPFTNSITMTITKTITITITFTITFTIAMNVTITQLCPQGTVRNNHLTTPCNVLGGGTGPTRVYGKATDCLLSDLKSDLVV